MDEATSGRVLLRAGAFVGERALGLAAGVVAGIVVARYLGPEQLGLLVFAQAMFGLVIPLIDLGLPAILIRDFSVRQDWRETLASAVTGQAAVGVVATAVAAAVVLWTRGVSTDIVLLVVAVSPIPLLGVLSTTFRTYHEAVGRTRRIVTTALTATLTSAGTKVLLVVVGAPLWTIGVAITLDSLILFVGHLRGIPARRTLGALRHRSDRAVTRRLLRESWPLLLAGVGVTIFMKVDVVMLGVLRGDQEAGIYSAAARLSEAWYFLPTAAMAAIRPVLSRLYADGEHTAYTRILRQFMATAALVGYLVVAGTWLAAELIISTLYGPDFGASSAVLRVHIVVLPLVFISVHPYLVDRGLTLYSLWFTGAAAVVNVGLNVVLIPRMGASGAAVATVASYALAGWLLNGVTRATRPLFLEQAKALLLQWPRTGPNVS